MSQTPFDDLEEGEIADDILPEPVVVKKEKALPRRYIINDKKFTTKHKKNCKHATHHHKQKTYTKDLHFKAKVRKKHHNVCSKHLAKKHLKFSNYPKCHNQKDFAEVNIINSKSHCGSPKLSLTTSAFKNFRSPPRKISKVESSKLKSPSLNVEDSYPKLFLDCKNTRSELSKFKNISNFKDNNKHISQISHQKSENTTQSQLSSENTPPLNNSQHNSDDDEDVEELRRIALATCSKRAMTGIDDALTDVSSNSKQSPITTSDNYEVVDMEVDNDVDTELGNDVDKPSVGADLFVIDKTPTYVCAPQTLINMHDTNPNIIEQNGALGNDFLPVINMNNAFPNLSIDILDRNLNNFCSDFPTPIENTHAQSSQLDADFEEQLLRAELIANISSMRQKDSTKDDIAQEKRSISFKNKIPNHDIVLNEERTVRFNDQVENHKTSHSNERIVSMESDVSNSNCAFKERTVSIVGDKSIVFNDKARNVSTYQKLDLHKATVSPVRKAVDIKVKVNNVQTSSSNLSVSSSACIIPQERIIISLNNESSSDESDLEDNPEEKQPDTNSAVASLEALIVNARNESDEKKNSNNSCSNQSDALSCLSKAQREEYDSLIRILAKNNKEFSLPSPLDEVKKVAEDAGLVLLKKQISIAKKNYETEKNLMNGTGKEVRKKKLAYISSKMRVQHLKEQLIMAERLRKSNLLLWNKCSKEFQTIKNSVSKRLAIINTLQAKINSYLPGQSSNGLSPISNHTPEHDY